MQSFCSFCVLFSFCSVAFLLRCLSAPEAPAGRTQRGPRRHVKGPKHRQACNSLNIDLLTDLIPGEAKELVKKPPVSLMLWALRLTFSSSAYLQYSKFVECGEITFKRHQDTLMSGRWSHKSMAKKVECRRGFGGYVGRETT